MMHIRRIGLVVVATGALVAAWAGGAQAYVYWSAQSSAQGASNISRAANDGSAPNRAFIPGGQGDGIVAVDATHIYWGNQDPSSHLFGIGRANLDGSGADPSWIPGLPSGIEGLAVDGTYVYWLNDYFIVRARLDGTGGIEQTFVISPGLQSWRGLAVAGGYLYSAFGLAGQIDRVPVDGGTPTPFLTVPGAGQVIVGSVATDGTYIYWTATHIPGGVVKPYVSIGRAPLTNPTSDIEDPFINGVTRPQALATDGTYLYWTDIGTTPESIGRAPIAAPGSPTFDFITDSGVLQGIAADDNTDRTTTSVSCLSRFIAPGSTVTCTATVGDSASTSPPTGTVNFTAGAGSVVLGNPCTLGVIGTQAQCTVGVQPTVAGDVSVTASYSGDNLHQPSSGSTPLCAGTALQCNPPPRPPACVVPRLKGKTLAKARSALTVAHCALGKVTRPKRARRHAKLVVGSTKPTAGTKLPDGAKVALRLVTKPGRRR
jgi:hypothetical protein